MGVCGRCGEDNPERARFCLACGTELERSAGAQSRKVITVLFADIVSSTALAERLDPEALRDVMNRCFHAMRTTVERHGGVVEKFVGDAVMAVFGIPAVHEDDALRAVRAGLDMQEAIDALDVDLRDRVGEPIQIRVGINTGEVIVGADLHDPASVIGDAVNAAARLEKLAAPGGVVIGAPTWQLVGAAVVAEPLGNLDLRGRTDPLQALSVTALRDEIASRRFETKLVGRSRELEAVMRAFDGVVEDRTCALFTVLGSAGVGKSRLTREFLDNLQDRARVLRGRCLSYGDGITMWPIAEALGDAAEISDRDSQEDALDRLTGLIATDEDAKTIANVVGQAIGLGEPTAGQEETFWALRRYLEILAGQKPLVVVFDDIHWAEPAFLDLVDHVVEWTQDSSLMVLCLARHELLEERPAWGGGKLNSTTVNLEPLKSSDAADLFASLLGKPAGSDLAAILEASGGNPLFLEETIAMLIDEGAIVESDDRWVTTRDIAQITIPPTIQALLSARIERLPREERSVIEVAAVVGKVFSTESLVGLTASDDIKGCLLSLHRKGVIQPTPGAGGEELFRFRHILIRDAAYNGLPKETRADLHARYADWILETLGERASEYEEIIGYHFEQAHLLRQELKSGRVGDPVASQAAEALARAGRRAGARDDWRAAINLLERARKLLPNDHPQVPYLLIEMGEQLWEHGEYDRCESLFEEAMVLAENVGDRIARERAHLRLEESYVHSRPKHTNEHFRQVVESSIEAFEEMGDHEGLAHAWRSMAYAYDAGGDSSRAAEAFEEAIRYAVASGDHRTEASYRRAQVQSLSWGPIAMSVLREKAEDFYRWSLQHSDPRSEAVALGVKATIEAANGDIEAARRLIDEQRVIYDELGLTKTRAWSVFDYFACELWAGDIITAQAELEFACKNLREKGERAVLPTILAMLADVRVRQGRFDEAETLVSEAAEIGSDDDVLTTIKCREVLGHIAAERGDHDRALELMGGAVALAETTEYFDWRGFAWMRLAEMQKQAGLTDDARASLSNAHQLFERKELHAAAATAQKLLGATTR